MAVSLIANVMLARFGRGIYILDVGHYRRDCTKAEPPTRDLWLKIVNDIWYRRQKSQDESWRGAKSREMDEVFMSATRLEDEQLSVFRQLSDPDLFVSFFFLLKVWKTGETDTVYYIIQYERAERETKTWLHDATTSSVEVNESKFI